MQLRNIIYSIALSILATTPLLAQISDTSYNGVNDPFSSYGLGTIEYDGLQTSAMMGHTGAAHQSTYIMNNANPASLAHIRITTLDFSLRGISSRASTQEENEGSGSFRPSYFYLSFPIGKNAGMTMGLDQKMGTLYRLYSVSQVQVGDSSMTATQKWLGNGSLNYFTLTGGYKWKELSFGVRMDYNFGNRQTENFLLFEDSVEIFGTDYLRTVEYRGLSMDLGLQYAKYLTLDSSSKISAGFVYGPNMNFKAKEESYDKSIFYRNNFQGYNDPDTFARTESGEGKYLAPSKLRVGLGYTIKDKLEAMADFTYLDFRNSYLFNDSLNLGTFQKFSVGLNYTPSAEPSRGLLSHSTFYTGFYFGKDYIQAADNDVQFWGVTGGISIPFSRNVGSVHLGIEYGSRGDIDQNLLRITNTYYTIGISFSDIWFRKRYYD